MLAIDDSPSVPVWGRGSLSIVPAATETRPIAAIVIGNRYRKDMGNIAALAKSIEEVGLLHPVVITPDGRLIAGQRRLEACRSLGWKSIAVRLIDLAEIERGEFHENVARKDFLPSEAVAIAEALQERERERAKERRTANLPSQAGNFPVSDPDAGRTRDKVAVHVGISGRTLEKAKAVVEAAKQEPEKYQPLADQMDRTGKVDRAYKELKREQAEQAKAVVPADLPRTCDRYRLVHEDFRTVAVEDESADFIITDPPYPREYLPLYGDLAAFAARVLKPGGSALVMVGQSYLPDVLAAMTPHLRYNWTLAYLTPGGQAVQVFPRKVNTFWKPVLWFVKGDYAGGWVGDVARSAVNDNDKRFHEWGQSESGMADLVDRFTYPGQTIVDPFLGGGTTGVVAVRMNRRFIGIDIDSGAVERTAARLAEIE